MQTACPSQARRPARGLLRHRLLQTTQFVSRVTLGPASHTSFVYCGPDCLVITQCRLAVGVAAQTGQCGTGDGMDVCCPVDLPAVRSVLSAQPVRQTSLGANPTLTPLTRHAHRFLRPSFAGGLRLQPDWALCRCAPTREAARSPLRHSWHRLTGMNWLLSRRRPRAIRSCLCTRRLLATSRGPRHGTTDESSSECNISTG